MMQGKRRGKKGPSSALDLNLAEAVDVVHVTGRHHVSVRMQKELGGAFSPLPPSYSPAVRQEYNSMQREGKRASRAPSRS
jgi:hypothetical protein